MESRDRIYSDLVVRRQESLFAIPASDALYVKAFKNFNQDVADEHHFLAGTIRYPGFRMPVVSLDGDNPAQWGDSVLASFIILKVPYKNHFLSVAFYVDQVINTVEVDPALKFNSEMLPFAPSASLTSYGLVYHIDVDQLVSQHQKEQINEFYSQKFIN